MRILIVYIAAFLLIGTGLSGCFFIDSKSGEVFLVAAGELGPDPFSTTNFSTFSGSVNVSSSFGAAGGAGGVGIAGGGSSGSVGVSGGGVEGSFGVSGGEVEGSFGVSGSGSAGGVGVSGSGSAGGVSVSGGGSAGGVSVSGGGSTGGVSVSGSGTTGGAAAIVRTGNQPGLYGGSRDRSSCNVTQLVSFLGENADKAGAFVGALTADSNVRLPDGAALTAARIGDYVGTLTPLILTQDTRVTNHGFRNGVANGFQSVLQGGTAVLVDAHGVPRVKCECGNPLLPPAQTGTTETYRGTQWTGFNPAEVMVVEAAPEPILVFVMVDVETGGYINRPVSTSGTFDVQNVTGHAPAVPSGYMQISHPGGPSASIPNLGWAVNYGASSTFQNAPSIEYGPFASSTDYSRTMTTISHAGLQIVDLSALGFDAQQVVRHEVEARNSEPWGQYQLRTCSNYSSTYDTFSFGQWSGIQWDGGPCPSGVENGTTHWGSNFTHRRIGVTHANGTALYIQTWDLPGENTAVGALMSLLSTYSAGALLASNQAADGQTMVIDGTQVRTGQIQVTLEWDSPADLDLFVTDPNGDRVNYANRSVASGGQLDVDSRASCQDTGSTVENIFWTANAPVGTYKVDVSHYSQCGDTQSVGYTVTLRRGGEIVNTWRGAVGDGNYDTYFFNDELESVSGSDDTMVIDGTQVRTGQIQVTLEWDSPADLDLFVTDPNGDRVNYANRSVVSGGQLDVDSRANCQNTGSTVENIVWSANAPVGTYKVDVSHYNQCGDTQSVGYTVTLRRGGEVVNTWRGAVGEGNYDTYFFNDELESVSGSDDTMVIDGTQVRTGQIQVTLEWDSPADLDLFVTDPNGGRVGYDNTSVASGGELDVDSRADCEDTGSTVENIVWSGNAPTGTYKVEVKHYAECGDTAAVSYTATLRRAGQIIETWRGSVGANGVDSYTFNE